MSWSLKIPPDRSMYAIGGGAGSRLVMATSSTSPISPASRRRFSAAKVGSYRRWKPIRQGTRAAATAAWTSRARPRSRSTGFSQKIAFRAAAARRMSPACVSVDEAIATACTAASEKIRSRSATAAPRFAASSLAAWGTASQTYLSRMPGWRARLPPWILPIRPAPIRAMSTIPSSLGLRRQERRADGAVRRGEPALYEIPWADGNRIRLGRQIRSPVAFLGGSGYFVRASHGSQPCAGPESRGPAPRRRFTDPDSRGSHAQNRKDAPRRLPRPHCPPRARRGPVRPRQPCPRLRLVVEHDQERAQRGGQGLRR